MDGSVESAMLMGGNTVPSVCAREGTLQIAPAYRAAQLWCAIWCAHSCTAAMLGALTFSLERLSGRGLEAPGAFSKADPAAHA